MEPIISAGKMMITSSCALIQTAKPLALNPKDPPTWQQLANHSKDVSDSIKKLVSSIRLVLVYIPYSDPNPDPNPKQTRSFTLNPNDLSQSSSVIETFVVLTIKELLKLHFLLLQQNAYLNSSELL